MPTVEKGTDNNDNSIICAVTRSHVKKSDDKNSPCSSGELTNAIRGIQPFGEKYLCQINKGDQDFFFNL